MERAFGGVTAPLEGAWTAPLAAGAGALGAWATGGGLLEGWAAGAGALEGWAAGAGALGGWATGGGALEGWATGVQGLGGWAGVQGLGAWAAGAGGLGGWAVWEGGATACRQDSRQVRRCSLAVMLRYTWRLAPQQLWQRWPHQQLGPRAG